MWPAFDQSSARRGTSGRNDGYIARDQSDCIKFASDHLLREPQVLGIARTTRAPFGPDPNLLEHWTDDFL
jgi:hypothetical protein